MAKNPPRAELPDRIPEILRNPMDTALLTALLPQYLDGLTFEDAATFCNGALGHQYLVGDASEEMGPGKDTGWRWFVDEVTQVEIIKRESNGNVLGKKARLHLATPGSRGNDSPTIDTGWIEYNGYYPEQYRWEVALANTIMELAEFAVEHGRRVAICKHVWADAGTKLRQVINLRLVTSKDDDAKEEVQSTGSRKSRGRQVDEEPSVEDRIDAAVEELDADGELEDKDVEFLVETLSKLDLDAKNFQVKCVAAIASYLEIPTRKVDDTNSAEDDDVKWAVQVLLDNL